MPVRCSLLGTYTLYARVPAGLVHDAVKKVPLPATSTSRSASTTSTSLAARLVEVPVQFRETGFRNRVPTSVSGAVGALSTTGGVASIQPASWGKDGDPPPLAFLYESRWHQSRPARPFEWLRLPRPDPRSARAASLRASARENVHRVSLNTSRRIGLANPSGQSGLDGGASVQGAQNDNRLDGVQGQFRRDIRADGGEAQHLYLEFLSRIPHRFQVGCGKSVAVQEPGSCESPFA